MTYIEMCNSFKRYKSGDSEIVANNNMNYKIDKRDDNLILSILGSVVNFCLKNINMLEALKSVD